MKKIKISLILCLLCSVTIFAEPTTSSNITAIVMLQPSSEPISGDDHFAPPTELIGAYMDFVAMVTGTHSVTFPISLGDHSLFAGSYIRTLVDLTLTPVHVSPRFDVTFSPFPFLNFNAGVMVGAGWNVGDFSVIKTYDKTKSEYITSSPFSAMYYNAYIQGNFQFDMAAIVPGDWNHIIITASYGLNYTGLTSGGDGTPWGYIIGGVDRANGLNYVATTMIGYAMPIALQMIGIQAIFNGYFFESDFDTDRYDWDPTFMTVALNAIAMVKITDNHSIAIQSGFTSRRSFDKKYADDVPIFAKKTVGREWYFNGVGVKYTYTF